MIVHFVLATFALSWLAGVLAFRIGREATFETPRALPVLLVMIWSPNIVALALTRISGADIGDFIAPIWRSAPLTVWLWSLAPLGVAAAIARTGTTERTPMSPVSTLAFVAINLIMGPTGEELGWRGFLLPEFANSGLLVTGVVIGAIWAVWHAPLWFMPSPHREIAFPIFAATVVCFSIIMTAMWSAAAGALGPIVVFHLTANVGVGWLELTGGPDAGTAYRKMLPFYVAIATGAAAWLML